MKQFYMITMLFAFFSMNVFGQEGWIKQTSPSSLGIMSVYAIDSLNIWAVGNEGLIIHTTDGGTTWDSIPSGTTSSLYAVEFINADTGWVAGSTNNDDDSHILRTIDGGASWDDYVFSNSWVDIMDVDFVEGPSGESMRGFCAGGLGSIWKTDDYGETWEDLIGDCGEGNFNSCCIADSITGWFVGTSSMVNPYTIMHTEDGGNTFEKQTNPATDIKLNGVCFGTDLKGIAVGIYGTILYTSDGGTTWLASVDGGNTRWRSVFINETGKAWAVGGGGTIAFSTDWGQTWVVQECDVPAGTELWEVYFINDNEGWTVGGGLGMPGVILHTKNGGYSTPGMVDEALSEAFTLYPNPVSDILTIESEFRLTKVEIYSIVGEKVKEIYSDFNSIQIGHLSKGIYILKIQSKNGFASKKFTKE